MSYSNSVISLPIQLSLLSFSVCLSVCLSFYSKYLQFSNVYLILNYNGHMNRTVSNDHGIRVDQYETDTKHKIQFQFVISFPDNAHITQMNVFFFFSISLLFAVLCLRLQCESRSHLISGTISR